MVSAFVLCMSAFRRRPGDSAQKTGYRFEKWWARIFGVEPTRGSGNQWYAKLDVADGSILWSLKSTDAESFRLTKALMREVQDAITGPGGIGGDVIPGIAVAVDQEPYVVLRAEDFMRLAQSDEIKYMRPTKANQKRARAKMTALERQEAADEVEFPSDRPPSSPH